MFLNLQWSALGLIEKLPLLATLFQRRQHDEDGRHRVGPRYANLLSESRGESPRQQKDGQDDSEQRRQAYSDAGLMNQHEHFLKKEGADDAACCEQ